MNIERSWLWSCLGVFDLYDTLKSEDSISCVWLTFSFCFHVVSFATLAKMTMWHDTLLLFATRSHTKWVFQSFSKVVFKSMNTLDEVFVNSIRLDCRLSQVKRRVIWLNWVSLLHFSSLTSVFTNLSKLTVRCFVLRNLVITSTKWWRVQWSALWTSTFWSNLKKSSTRQDHKNYSSLSLKFVQLISRKNKCLASVNSHKRRFRTSVDVLKDKLKSNQKQDH